MWLFQQLMSSVQKDWQELSWINTLSCNRVYFQLPKGKFLYLSMIQELIPLNENMYCSFTNQAWPGLGLYFTLEI